MHVYLCSFCSFCYFAFLCVISFSPHLRPGGPGLARRLPLDYEDEDEDVDERQGGPAFAKSTARQGGVFTPLEP